MPNPDADARNADWLRIQQHARELAAWTWEAIDTECMPAYQDYADALRGRHRRWPHSPNAAREQVFPSHLSWLSTLFPPSLWHQSWWAAKSSQTLALTLLATACRSQPSLDWLPFAKKLGERPIGLFEIELAPDVLNEQPFQTQLDFLALGSDGVIAVEAKFTERGFSPCRCAGRAAGECSERVRARPYWSTAASEFGLRDMPGRCPLSLVYQPVRNVAAARAIAGDRASAFVLVFDDRNPYFTGSGRWPGWISVLEGLTRHTGSSFASLPWQALLGRADFDAETLEWARDKHGLEAVEET